MVIFNANNNNEKKLKRRDYLRHLANELIYPYLKIRVTTQNLPVSLKVRIREICGITDVTSAFSERNATKGRCAFCTTKKNRCTRFSCIKCKKFMCLEHIHGICQYCISEYMQ